MVDVGLQNSTMEELTTLGQGSMPNASAVLEPKPPFWSLSMTIFLSFTMVIFMSCAIVGNILVLSVVSRHRGMRTRTNMFLCSLAIADLLCAVLDMPIALITVINGDWLFGSYTGAFCKFNGFTIAVSFVTSIHTLMYISIHKYISITRPFSRTLTHRRILMMIAAAWLWSALTGYITIHGLSTVVYKPYTTQCGPEYPHDLRTYMLPLWTCVSCYLIPFSVMTFCYIRVFQEIRAHSLRLEQYSNQEKATIFEQQRRITKTLLLVLVVFALSWTPYIIYSVYASVIKDKSELQRNVNALSYWCGYMNSACNPIIYALRSPAFREGYKEVVCHTQAAITSEDRRQLEQLIKTDPYEVYGPFQRLQKFIKKSTRHSSVSSGGSVTLSRKNSFIRFTNFIMPGNRRTYSTNSLPEGYKYRSTGLPRITFIDGVPAITIDGRVIYSKNISVETQNSHRRTVALAEYEENVNTTLEVMKEENGAMDYGRYKIPLKDELKNQYNAETSNMTEQVLENVISVKAPLLETDAVCDGENVFITEADVEDSSVNPALPRIEVVADESSNESSHARYLHSMSEFNETKPEKVHIAPFSSDDSLKKKSGKTYLRNMFRHLRGKSESPRPSRGKRHSEQDMLKVIHSERSHSDSGDPRRASEGYILSVPDDHLQKSVSDTMISPRSPKSKKRHDKPRKKKRRSYNRTLSEDSNGSLKVPNQDGEICPLTRSHSDKPIRRYPSIEHLDKRRHGHSSRKHHARRHVLNGKLIRSISDPGLTFGMIRERMLHRRETRKYLHKQRLKSLRVSAPPKINVKPLPVTKQSSNKSDESDSVFYTPPDSPHSAMLINGLSETCKILSPPLGKNVPAATVINISAPMTLTPGSFDSSTNHQHRPDQNERTLTRIPFHFSQEHLDVPSVTDRQSQFTKAHSEADLLLSEGAVSADRSHTSQSFNSLLATVQMESCL